MFSKEQIAGIKNYAMAAKELDDNKNNRWKFNALNDKRNAAFSAMKNLLTPEEVTSLLSFPVSLILAAVEKMESK